MNSFYLAARKWKIKIITEASFKKIYPQTEVDRVYGYCNDETATIYLVDPEKYDEALQKITLYHEIIHAILFTQGYSSHDEALIDGVAHLLHQIEKTWR